jgi:hypothetical protein
MGLAYLNSGEAKKLMGRDADDEQTPRVEDPEEQAMIDEEESIYKKKKNTLAIPPYRGITT